MSETTRTSFANLLDRVLRRSSRAMRNSVFAALVVSALTCDAGETSDDSYTVVARFPHDTTAFTQGLVFGDDRLYESTGLLGRSEVRQVQLNTGYVEARVFLAPDRFGEGLALLEGHLYQLTWKSGVGYVYDATTLSLADSFSYEGEGWGLTSDGSTLVMSDGTAVLRFIDPRTFQVRRRVTVRDNGSPLTQLNELEYARGDLFANVYGSDWIVRIDPESGHVREWLDLNGLLPAKDRTRATGVLNGIAYHAESGHLFVTGKFWPAVFELGLRSAPGDSILNDSHDRR